MTLKECQKIVAKKHNLGNSLVSGHKSSYFDEAAEMYANQFKKEIDWSQVEKNFIHNQILFAIPNHLTSPIIDWFKKEIENQTK
jgi:hypothetical protein